MVITKLTNRFLLPFLMVLTLFTGERGAADFLPGLSTPITPPEQSNGHLDSSPLYAFPNEQFPAFSSEILQFAIPGVYIALGSERGFIGATLAPKVTHLLLTDSDLGMVKLNQINIVLLKIARNREDYIQLRFHSTSDQWKQRLRETTNLSLSEQRILEYSAFHAWWEQVQNAKNIWGSADFLVGPEGQKKDPLAFKDANYLWNDDQFAKIQGMAQADRIQSIYLDWSLFPDVNTILQGIKDANLEVSILDLSNAWDRVYIGIPRLLDLLERNRNLLQSASILLLTLFSKVPELQLKGFGYLGVSMDHLIPNSPSLASLQAFLEIHDPTSYGKKPYQCSIEDFARFNPY